MAIGAGAHRQTNSPELQIEWIRAIVVLMGIYSTKSFQLMPIESKYP